MSLSSDGGTVMTMPVQPAYQGGNGGFGWGGDWEADMRGTYGRGSSYRGRKRDSMGRYSRDGRMDGYSHHNARESMMELAREMMENTSSEREREAIRRFMTELERD